MCPSGAPAAGTVRPPEARRRGCKLAAEGDTAAGGLSPQRVEELRGLALQMVEGVMQRFAEHTPAWNLQGVVGTSAAVQSAATLSPAKRARLEAKCRELEAELRRKREEVAQRQEELFAKCKGDFAVALNSREQELLEVQQAVSFDSTAINDSARAADLQNEFSDQLRAVQSRLAEVRQTAIDLDSKMKGLEKIEALQQSGLLPVEELLARGCADGASDDEDQALLAAIQQGEQVCKRMRRHLAVA